MTTKASKTTLANTTPPQGTDKRAESALPRARHVVKGRARNPWHHFRNIFRVKRGGGCGRLSTRPVASTDAAKVHRHTGRCGRDGHRWTLLSPAIFPFDKSRPPPALHLGGPQPLRPGDLKSTWIHQTLGFSAHFLTPLPFAHCLSRQWTVAFSMDMSVAGDSTGVEIST